LAYLTPLIDYSVDPFYFRPMYTKMTAFTLDDFKKKRFKKLLLRLNDNLNG